MTAPLLRGTLLFHLNLSYSSIEVDERAEVVRRCYRPLLSLADDVPGVRIAVEATGHTLERIDALDPEWIDHLRSLIGRGRVELVGSGDTQLIGPLVPESVNRWNQRLGQATYERLTGVRPEVALVNEMAWSQGIVDAYDDAGYRALVMEWNNPRRAHAEWDDEWRYRVVETASPTGRRTRVLWADAVAMQKLQRVVTDELELDEYLGWILGHRGEGPRHLTVYSGDAEVFDYRPGRYRAEAPLANTPREWDRLAGVLARLIDEGVELALPSDVVADPALASSETLVLNAASNPIPVKKQPKYNATRWGLTGRDDVGLNAWCFARARALESQGGTMDEWRDLCRSWASDLRTHLTEERWRRWSERRDSAALASREHAARVDVPDRHPELQTARVDEDGRRVRVTTDDVELTLLPRRGLAIESLAFPSAGPAPVVGTLSHGHFDDIDFAADFYTGHVVLDEPARRRVTDLERAEPKITRHADRISVSVTLETELGPLEKTIDVFADSVRIRYGFSAWGERPACTLRAGFVTLLPSGGGGLGEELFVTCANGGAPERLPLEGAIDHGATVSPLVSAQTAFGATDGRFVIDDGTRGVELSWPNHEVAALPVLTHKTIASERFVRVAFSLAEIDETHRPGAFLPDFVLAIRGKRSAA